MDRLPVLIEVADRERYLDPKRLSDVKGLRLSSAIW